ncbi:MAG: Ig-like domain-containing protein [Myxococcaceae bacterium]
MKRALLLLAFCGCLSTDKPTYQQMDTKRPKVSSISPGMGDQYGGDGGIPTLTPGEIITITFSEPMDLESLRPGIAIRDINRVEQPLNIYVAPSVLATLGINQMDSDYSFPVQVSSPSGLTPGSFQLILRELLIDQQGNTLEVDLKDGGISDNGYVATFAVQQ